MTKKGFTLVELLVVVGIMASMATLSIGSYFAVVRGMADRGAIATATSAIALAQERACIDLVPTVVYFYNEIVQREDEDEGDEMVVAGVAIAVRRAGRISNVTGSIIGDEFGDLNKVYGAVEDVNDLKGDTFRLYRFNVSKMEYSSVYSSVAEYPIRVDASDFLVEGPIASWSEAFKKDDEYTTGTEDVNELLSYAFKVKSGFEGWKVGDAYAYEFVRVQLPDNYIFGTSGGDAPSDGNRVKMLDNLTILCEPDRASSESSLEKSVQIMCKTPSGSWRSVGKTKKEMKDI
jgi:prepilin-type N-terminal cleavage/methylation domain-containing protein